MEQKYTDNRLLLLLLLLLRGLLLVVLLHSIILQTQTINLTFQEEILT